MAERLARKEQERLEKHSQWQAERHETAHLMRKEPLFRRLEKEYSAHLQEKEMELKEKYQEDRRTKFKPLIQQELDQFSNKVDKIVSYLTRKRQEERTVLYGGGSADLVGLRTQTYEQVVEKDREVRIAAQ